MKKEEMKMKKRGTHCCWHGREGEGELVKSEELYERLHCMKCNFVTSAKRKKVRIDGLRRYVTGTVPVTAEEQTALEDANCSILLN